MAGTALPAPTVATTTRRPRVGLGAERRAASGPNAARSASPQAVEQGRQGQPVGAQARAVPLEQRAGGR